jgi:hypothetical protein
VQTLSDLYGILSGENTPETPDFAENQRKTPEKRREDAAFPAGDDTREKLEADMREIILGVCEEVYTAHPNGSVFDPYGDPDVLEGLLGSAIGLLDRQAAMVERYWKAQVNALASKGDQLADANTKLTDKIGEITNEVSELMKKQPYTFDPNDAPDSLRTVGRYIDELKRNIAELAGEVKRQWKVIETQEESLCKLKSEGCSCPEVIEHLENGITYGVSVDGVEYVRETGRMRALEDENRNLHRELSRLNEQVRGTRQLPKKCKWPRKDGKLVKIAPTQAREIAFDRTGGWIRWSDSERETTRFKYGEEL